MVFDVSISSIRFLSIFFFVQFRRFHPLSVSSCIYSLICGFWGSEKSLCWVSKLPTPLFISPSPSRSLYRIYIRGHGLPNVRGKLASLPFTLPRKGVYCFCRVSGILVERILSDPKNSGHFSWVDSSSFMVPLAGSMGRRHFYANWNGKMLPY